MGFALGRSRGLGEGWAGRDRLNDDYDYGFTVRTDAFSIGIFTCHCLHALLAWFMLEMGMCVSKSTYIQDMDAEEADMVYRRC